MLRFMIQVIAIAMFGSSILVLGATKGRHPGWLVLGLIGLLMILGM